MIINSTSKSICTRDGARLSRIRFSVESQQGPLLLRGWGRGMWAMQRKIKEIEVTLQDALESCLQERCAGMSETVQKTKEKVSSTRTKARGRAVHNAQPACGCCCATLKKLPRYKV